MKLINLSGLLALTVFTLAACGGGGEITSIPEQRAAIIMSGASSVDPGKLSFPHPRANYTIEKTSSGYLIKDTATGTSTTVASNVTRIQFADVSLAFDIDIAGKVYRLYRAAFNRQPDLGGLGFWLDVVTQGQTLEHVALGFMQSPEFFQLFGSNPTDQEFITKLYSNVLHRAPDNDGMTFWINALKTSTTRAQVLIYFSESPENIAQVASSIENGVAYAQSGVAYQPVANAGEDKQGKVATAITLSGKDSFDANGDTLGFTWTLSKPAGSYVNAVSYNTNTLTFTPDVAGTYTATLTVTDGKMFSAPDTVSIVIAAQAVTPVADTGTYKCSTITHAYALQLYNQGHTYLDRDHDGKPCEATDIAVEIATATPTVPSTPSTGMCYVNGYYRKNGTYVKGYWRRC